MFKTMTSGLGGYSGIIGAFGLGDDHVAPGLSPRRRRPDKATATNFFKQKG